MRSSRVAATAVLGMALIVPTFTQATSASASTTQRVHTGNMWCRAHGHKLVLTATAAHRRQYVGGEMINNWTTLSRVHTNASNVTVSQEKIQVREDGALQLWLHLNSHSSFNIGKNARVDDNDSTLRVRLVRHGSFMGFHYTQSCVANSDAVSRW